MMRPLKGISSPANPSGQQPPSLALMMRDDRVPTRAVLQQGRSRGRHGEASRFCACFVPGLPARTSANLFGWHGCRQAVPGRSVCYTPPVTSPRNVRGRAAERTGRHDPSRHPPGRNRSRACRRRHGARRSGGDRAATGESRYRGSRHAGAGNRRRCRRRACQPSRRRQQLAARWRGARHRHAAQRRPRRPQRAAPLHLAPHGAGDHAALFRRQVRNRPDDRERLLLRLRAAAAAGRRRLRGDREGDGAPRKPERARDPLRAAGRRGAGGLRGRRTRQGPFRPALGARPAIQG